MKNFKMFVLFSAVCFLLALVAGCGGRVERSDETNPIPSIPCGQYGDCARYLPCATGGTIECTPTGCVWNGPGDVDLSCAVDADGGSGGTGGSVATGGSAGQPDAGGEAGSSGEDVGTNSDAGCEPRLVATWNAHNETTACPGDSALQTLSFTLKAECQDMEMKLITLQLFAPDFAPTDSTPFCKAPCTSPDDWYFRNLKLVTSTGAVVMGPLDTPSQAASSAQAYLMFSDAFTLKAGESKLLTLQMDVAATYTSALTETRYQAFLNGVNFGDGNIPYVVENNVDPNATIKVKKSCSSALKVEDAKETASRIVTPTPDYEWPVFTSYWVSNSSNVAITISSVTVEQVNGNASPADFKKVGLWDSRDNKIPYGPVKATLTTKGNSLVFENLKNDEGESLTIGAGEKFRLIIAALMATPVATSVQGDVARSGHTPALKITYMAAEKGAVQATIAPHEPPFMVLRKSKLTVTKLALASTQLVNGDMGLYKFQVTSDPAGPVSVKSFSIPVQKKSAVSISQFRLRKGNVDLSASAYLVEVLDFDNFTKHDSIESGMKNVSIAVQLTSEEVIAAGSNVVFTLHGIVAAADTGASIDIGLGYGGPLSEGSLTSWLVKMKPTDKWVVLYTPELTNGAYWENNFIWSDCSEVPHSDAEKSQGGSRDWISDAYVGNLNWSSTKTTLIAP